MQSLGILTNRSNTGSNKQLYIHFNIWELYGIVQAKIFSFLYHKIEGTGIAQSVPADYKKKTWGQFLFTGAHTRKKLWLL